MIHAENLSVFFRKGFLRKKIKALDGFSIDINKGDIFGLLGPNGAGKSTAMYCFLGLIKPDLGQINILGAPPEPGAKIFERIAYVPEDPHYHLYLTVEEALIYYAALYNVKLTKAQAKTILEKVGMFEHYDLKLEKCSKGMKQKLGIACCLIKEVDIVFLDEPTRGLDPIMVKEFRDIILELNRAGVTFIINSHILSEIELICNRVAIINKGKVILQDELRNLMKLDYDTYSVECEVNENLPDYINIIERTDKIIKAEIPLQNISEFFRLAIDNDIKVFDCALKRISLEDAFFKILKGEQ